jgi:RND family efflux transporter MFP subunit
MATSPESSSSPSMRRWRRSSSWSDGIPRVPGLPLVVVALGGLVAWGIISIRPPPAKTSSPVPLPTVSVIEVAPRDMVVTLRSQGTVEASREIDLAAEVSGVVRYVSPEFEAGGAFAEGVLLIALDPGEAEIALRQASAVLELAEVEHQQIEARRRRLEALANDGVESSARREDITFSVRIAAARIRRAMAERDAARRRLLRTELRAPFDGRVRATHAHTGEFVQRGQPLARILASGELEVRLPIREADLPHLDLAASEPPRVQLRSTAGRVWAAQVLRLEAALAERTHMAQVRARLDPGDTPPPIGEFVHAEIQGPALSGVTSVPRSALAEDERVLVVTSDGRAEARAVEVIRVEGDVVWIGKGLVAGELVTVPAASHLLGFRVATRLLDRDSLGTVRAQVRP